MSKTDSLKSKIVKKGSPAREFINAYKPEAAPEKKESTPEADSVTVDKTKTELNNDINNNANNSNINNASNTEAGQEVFSVIDNLLESEKKKPVKEFVGIYLDADIHQGLNNLCKKSKQRGLKSKIVNDILRSVFEQQGIIK